MSTNCGLDQLGCNANAITGSANTPFNYVAHTELSPDLTHVYRFVLVLEARIASDHEQLRKPRQRSDNVFSDAITADRYDRELKDIFVVQDEVARAIVVKMVVARSGSMAKAARDLGMSQPSVSEAIAKLEAAVRVRLVDRGPRGIEPTIYANALLRREQVVSDELQQGIRDIEFLANPTAGEVRIGCPENLACGFVPTIIDRISRRYPKITFQVIPLEPAAMGFRELRERRVDVTVGRIVHPRLDDDLDAGVLFEDRLRVVAGASSPWARRRKIAMEELMHEPWLHTPEDNAVNAYVAAALRARGLALPTPTVSTYSMHVRYNLLSTGRFLALLWNWTLHFNSNGGTVKALPVELGIPSRPVATVRLKNRTLSPVVELFIEEARDIAKSMTKSSPG